MLINLDKITSCYIGPEISPEHFIAEHFFIYLIKGSIQGYDGHKHHTMAPGEGCIVRRNNLARYNKQKENGQFEKAVVIFDQAFLNQFAKRNKVRPTGNKITDEVFIKIAHNNSIPAFLQSLTSYYNGEVTIHNNFSDEKREALLKILLKNQPSLSDILFDFGIPEKIDLEAFMNRNFRFNVALQRFAYLTGRSLSSFKRDFEKTFHLSPARWLIRKRLKEAYFLIEKKGRKVSDVYIEVGFEDLSHFSFAFKKQFGYAPTHLPRLVKEAVL